MENIKNLKKMNLYFSHIINLLLRLRWKFYGYIIVQRLFSESEVDFIWSSFENDLSNSNKYRKDTGGCHPRILNPHFLSDAVYDLMNCERIYRTIKRFFPKEIVPFQSISSHHGSEQNVHSDAIHMTTRPLGGLVAAWVAFESVTEDSGPVEYYPKSHRLPYILSKDVGINPNEFEKKGYAEYATKYEPFIHNKINKLSLKSKKFIAKKGDVLFWHHNLLHGGAKIVNKSSTRKSFVFHYFRKDVHCYHDLSGRDADLSFYSN